MYGKITSEKIHYSHSVFVFVFQAASGTGTRLGCCAVTSPAGKPRHPTQSFCPEGCDATEAQHSAL